MGTFYCLLVRQEELPVDKAFYPDDTSRGVLCLGYGSGCLITVKRKPLTSNSAHPLS